MNKIALDDAAKKYWAELYGEYGEALVRDIPRRIKAALAANKKIASADDDASINPIASARTASGSIVEGLYVAKGTKLLFRASIDTVGAVQDVQTIEVR